jgi:hypothetical protein
MKISKICLIPYAIGIIIAGFLSVPALTGLAMSGHETGENRTLAQRPKNPRSISDLFKYPRELEPWINDHFGLRRPLIWVNNKLRYKLFGQFPTIQVISGRKGRIFLSSHSMEPSSQYSAITIPCGDIHISPEKVAGPLNALHESFRREGIDARILIVPSSPVIYPEALPAWLEARCNAAGSPIELVLASSHLEAEARKAIYFPRAEMLALKDKISVFPQTWFHWAGAGSREVAGLSVKFFWGVPANTGRPLAEESKLSPSDISHLFPGVKLASQVEHPDHARSGIEACVGPRCFPSLGSVTNKLQDVAYYRNLAAPQERLIILSDSFGKAIAGWYPRYFKEVIHFSTNSLNQLNVSENRQLWAYIKAQARIGHLLLLYHDGSTLWGRPEQDYENLFVKQ